MTGTFAYDAVSYGGHPYDYTHPNRLATVGALYGMEPRPLSNCRVLELGCGNGANLIPVAYQWPQSEFLGVDLSRSAIEQGQAFIASMKLGNIDLRHCDIMQFGAEFGAFDYIIAHGVYSWVPADVREKMLALLGEHLAPHGIAYVSYNSLPGSHLRDLAREIMNYHARPFRDPREHIEQARKILQVTSEASDPDSIFGAVLRREFGRISQMADATLFHDDLAETHQAFLLSDFVADARRHDLQYLSDATYWRSDLQHFALPARELLQALPAEATVAREQFQDFIEGHMFRRTVLCRGDLVLSRSLNSDCLQRFHLAAEVTPENDGLKPGGDEVAAFKVGGAGTLATDHRLSKAAMLYLGQNWPGVLRFPALVEGALGLLGDAADAIRPKFDEEVETLKQILFRAALAGHLSLHLFPPKLTTGISERPRASRLARKQAESGRVVTTLQHASVILEDDILHQFLALVDGTRTVDELLADLTAEVKARDPSSGVSASEPPELTKAAVVRNLGRLVRLGLLEA